MTVYNKHLESLPDTSSQIFDWKQFARHSFSLFGGIRLSRQTSKTSKSTASLSLAERWTTTVGAARKVSPDWSQETMTCHSSNCFSIV